MIRILRTGEYETKDILTRGIEQADVSKTVKSIIDEVRQDGDKALFAFTERFDGARLCALEVSAQEMDEAVAACGEELLCVIKEAAGNIRQYHEKQMRSGFRLDKEGIVLGQKVTPLSCVGLYVPGGTASYPSTVLMDAIPAKIAGVNTLIMVTPPGKDGKIKPSVLAAARIAGVDRIFKLGGAQAIAALAYGTESVPKTVKIVGPGNVFVAEAKRQVYGLVDIDMIAGPSEILIVADEKNDPAVLAADMLSQAEHDKNASAVLVTTKETLALAVSAELERQVERLERREIARASIDNNGKIILVPSIDEAIRVSNEIAPEHLELCVEEPFTVLEQVENAGSVFLGRFTPEALGDYFAGTNHTLPTSGTAKFSSPLSVDDFIKKTAFTYYSRDALKAVAGKVALFADEEGLGAHARSVLSRFEEAEK